MTSASRATGDRVAYQFSSFGTLPLMHGMSGRVPGVPAEGQVAHARDTVPEVVENNRTAFLSELGVDPTALTVGRQVHGSRIQFVTSQDRGRGTYPALDAFPETDGLLTTSPDVALGIIVSDCAPLLLYDPTRHVLAVAHAGWRGTVGGIAREAVAAFTEHAGSDPTDLIAGIGPSIGPCCYEVGDEVIERWRALGIADAESAIVPGDPRPHFDLWRANQLVLQESGVPASRIERADVCTRCCGERFFSYRASAAGDRPRGSMIMVAQLH